MTWPIANVTAMASPPPSVTQHRCASRVGAAREYYAPKKPLVAQAPERDPDVLDLTDVAGRRVIETRTHGRISIRADHAAAALEVMSRFALDPRWLVYLPPTMSPVATSVLADLLEHPAEAFEAYRGAGIDEVVCEEKHMGSRAVVFVCRDPTSSPFGIGAPAPCGHAPAGHSSASR
jgi:protein phosphatase